MLKDLNRPSIQFQGLKDKWVVKKLGEVGHFKNGMNMSKDLMGYGYPFVNLQDVFGKHEINNEKLGLVFSTHQQQKEYNLLQGDVLFVRSSVKFEGVGKTAVVASDIPNATYSGFIIRFRSNNELEYKFKRVVFQTKSIRDHILTNATSSANININQDSLKDINLYLPSQIEQKRIGDFFKNLDQILFLAEQKYEKTKQFRKAMLNSMLPNAIGLLPKLRFSNFADDWQETKIVDCFEERNERSDIGELISVTISSGVKKSSTINRHDTSSDDKSNYKKVEVNDIAYNSMRMWQGASGVSNYSGILSPAYTVMTPKENISSLFFSYYFKLPHMLYVFQKNSQGLTSDTWNLKFPMLKKIEVLVPSFEEQQAIGEFFKKIDATLDLQAQKIEKLKNLKTTLLEKMFV